MPICEMAMVMNKAEDPFKIRAHVDAFDLLSEGYCRASQESRARWSTCLNVAYGPSERERLDLYFPKRTAQGAPLHMFIHGGYWRANSKDDYGFVANTVCGAGAIAAILGYALMPQVRMAQLIGQIRRAAFWLHENIGDRGGNPAALSASGHSAGAHLASYLCAHGPNEPAGDRLAPVASLLLVSGVYDLAPIRRSFLQSEINLTREEVACWSPLSGRLAAAPSFIIAVGDRETSPFRRQAASLSRSLRYASVRIRQTTLANQDHMTIMRDLGTPGTAAARLIEACIGDSVRASHL